MIVIILIAVIFALLIGGSIYALLAKDNGRKGQSGSPRTASDAKQGRASGLD